MTTSDGICSSDWSVIEDCAEEIAAASSQDLECGLLIFNMKKRLDQLKKKYGRLPSILATEADYVGDHEQQLALLKEAFITACEIGDNKNIAFIAASLAELYLEDVKDFEKADFWRAKLESSLVLFSDSYLLSVLADVTEEIFAKKSNK